MEKMMTAKELRTAAEDVILGKVTNRESYENALLMVFETAARAKTLRDSAREFAEQSARIGELCAAYAQEHPTALDEPLAERRDGVVSGTVALGEYTYRLTLSKDGYKRISGANLTQGFLAELPRGWTKSKLELNEPKLKTVENAELVEHDLVRPGKAIWSRAEKTES